MRDFNLSADQVRNAAGCTFSEAQAAVYMASGALSGWRIGDLDSRTALGPRACREWAFRWGIQFADYDPFAKPRRIEWCKAKKGWELIDAEVIGTCLRESDGKYRAKVGAYESARWSPADAMADVTAMLDLESDEPIMAVKTSASGLTEEIVFPVEDDEVLRCRDALQFRTMRKAAA